MVSLIENEYKQREADYKFFAEVGLEVKRAREKFPDPNCLMAALAEETGELAQALLKVAGGKWDKQRIYEEAVQVAAMACRIANEGDPSIKLDGKNGENQ